RVQPGDVFDPVSLLASEEFVGSQRRVLAPEAAELSDEIDELAIGIFPIEPGDFIVLRIGIVVALLGPPELVPRRNHRRAVRNEQRRQHGADIALSRRVDILVPCRTFRAIVPGIIGVMAVAIVLTIGLIVLAL